VPGPAGRRWILATAGAVVLAGAGLFTLRAVPGSAPGSGPAPDPEVTVSRSACGADWTAPEPGPQTLQVHNTGAVTTTVELVDPGTGALYGELEGVGPGTTRALPVVLGDGEYAFRCLPDDDEAVAGPTVRISGTGVTPGPAVVPVTNADLFAPARTYQERVVAGLDTLVRDSATLDAAVHGGDRAAAETAWLTAHLDYSRLGAAYGAFGDAADAIDGTADGLPGGRSDPEFTGFHRLEDGLWHGEPTTALVPVADGLDANVRDLREAFPSAQVDPLDLALRAHEIVEDALRFQLTGRDDYGSGTGIATALAGIDGTRTVLDVLQPLLAARMPTLPTIDMWLDRATTAAQQARRPDGSWTPVAALAPAEREQIDGAFGELAEQLAPVATVLAPRRTS
jgi:iron uptake system component EfeO